MNKLLTVVIPTYNMEALLPRCIDSLVGCSKYLKELEILVINDGSKDKSLEIAQDYERRYPNIVFAIDKKNGNYGSAINKGIEISTGKYFRILDSDDFYNTSELSKFLDTLSTLNVDLVLTNYRQDRGDMRRYFTASEDIANKFYRFSNFDITCTPNFAMHGITYKTSILKENNIKLLTGISYTDSEYCFYPLSFVKDIYVSDACVYCYQLGRPGQTVEISSQVHCIPHMLQIIFRMSKTLMDNVNDKSVYSKQLAVMCNSINLCLSTSLCYDVNNTYLNDIDKIMGMIDNTPGASELLSKSNMFGVYFYKRYALKHKTSNSKIFQLYYRFVRLVGRIVFRVKSLLKNG